MVGDLRLLVQSEMSQPWRQAMNALPVPKIGRPFLLLSLSVSLCWSAAACQSPAEHGAPCERTSLVLRALLADDADPSRFAQAIYALAELADEAPPARDALIDRWLNPPQQVSSDWLCLPWALAPVRDPTLPRRVIACYEEGHPDEELLQRTLATIGLLGANDREITAWLTRQLGLCPPGSQLEGQIRVLLAACNRERHQHVAWIVEGIRRGSPAGAGALDMLTFIAAHDWVTPELVDVVAERALGDGPDADVAVMALGRLAGAAEAATPALERALAAARKRGDGCRTVLLELSLARVDSQRRQSWLRQAAKTAVAGLGGGHNMGAGAMALRGPSAEVVKGMADLLRDTDAEVVEGTLLLLNAAGRGAADATPAVIRTVQEGPNDHVKGEAAWSLRSIARPAAIAEIEELVVRENDAGVRRQLVDSLRIIRTGKMVAAAIGRAGTL